MAKHLLLAAPLLFSTVGLAQCNTPTPDVFPNDSTNAYCWEILNNKVRRVTANNIPPYPFDPQNPNATMEAKDHEFTMCAFPVLDPDGEKIYFGEEDPITPNCNRGTLFGVTLTGVLLQPYADLYFEDQNTGLENHNWTLDPSNAIQMDDNGGHVNGQDLYHHHRGAKEYYQDVLGIDGSSHSPIVGYAADGFPVYYRYMRTNPNGGPNSPIVEYTSSYALKSGNRPGDGISAPDGPYDGDYKEDYEYVANQSTLDECNSIWAKTPEFPNGTLCYVITDDYPYISRCWRGAYVDHTFRQGTGCPGSQANTECGLDPDNSISNLNEAFGFRLFPNPAINTLNMALGTFTPESITGIHIMNISGKVVHSLSEFRSSIDVSTLPSGVYFVSIMVNKESITRKFIIEK